MTDRGVQDNPGVIVMPPFLYLGAFVVMLLLRWPWPMPILAGRLALWPGLVLVALGITLAVVGRRALEAAGTNVNHGLPTTAIVTGGPYRYTRNPLYVALAAFFLGVTLGFNTWWGVVLLVPVLGVMHWGVIRREERYLERKFGQPYREYCSRVRRYL
jgi:protein-S-isoprenylcysteine O-methyltransferase Ste14